MAEAVIHTKSSYVPSLHINVSNNADGIDLLYDMAYDYLRTQELIFYRSFFPEVSSYEQFIEKIRELFNKASEDRAIFEQFTQQNLASYVPQQQVPLVKRGYKVTIIGDSKTLDFSFKGENCTMSGKAVIDVVPENIQLIKTLLNKSLGRSSQSITAFKEDSNVTSNLVSILEESLTKDSSIGTFLKVTADGKGGRQKAEFSDEFDITKVSKWTKTELQDLLASGDKAQLEKVRQEVRKALNIMHNFLFKNYNKASENMKKAMDSTWNELFPRGSDVLTRDFFFEGKNYTKALTGQVGEFANKVFIKYLDAYRSSATSEALVNMIGSIFKGGQEPRSDLQIMLACGANINFQTKNVNTEHTIETNTTAALISENFGSDIIVPLVNYYANTSSGRNPDILQSIEDLLSSRFYEAMNLNVRSGLDQFQTNTFYFVGGNNIIPGSEIIQMLRMRVTNPTFHITGGNVTSYDDEGYESGDPPTFIELGYWKYPKGQNSGEMEVGPKNAPAFNTAAQSISISTSFSVNALVKTGNFEIFPKH